MAIQPGYHLGPYEILAAIGAGGMGEVYRARDSKLGRDVAIKVLPEAFARDADRMARFQREAKFEVAWVQNVVNTDQVRFVRLQGDRLTVREGWVLDGVTYGGNSELVWDRVKSETSDK